MHGREDKVFSPFLKFIYSFVNLFCLNCFLFIIFPLFGPIFTFWNSHYDSPFIFCLINLFSLFNEEDKSLISRYFNGQNESKWWTLPIFWKVRGENINQVLWMVNSGVIWKTKGHSLNEKQDLCISCLVGIIPL